MGDDLIFAQKFTRTAADGLALLVEMDNPRSTPEASVVIDMMTTVQRGAKRLRARNIYTSAQGVLSALHHENDAILNGRISTLGSLVTEYARGLDELLPAQEDIPQKTSADKWDMARETLNSLLPVAPAGDADMLSRLMRAPVTLADVHPEQNDTEQSRTALETDIINFETHKVETPGVNMSLTETDAVIETVPTLDIQPINQDLQTAAAPKSSETHVVALDAMMRDVIADALSVARAVGRTISLSYDMGERSVSAESAENLRGRVGKALSQIIRQSMTEGRVSHIDVNLAGEQLHIMAGTTAVRVAIDPQSAPKSKPLITAETEQGLRTQLNALMDPVSRHETAS